jgi:Tol biopolymer transport system component
LYRNDESGFIPAFIALSPDGTWLAFYCRTSGASGSGSALKVISISDHTARSVYRSVNGSIGGIAWMPDSKSLALSVRGSGESGSVSSIWLAPIDGGPAMKTALEVGANILSPSLGPDGQRLLYTVVGSKPGQLWALENVLPQAKAGATKK